MTQESPPAQSHIDVGNERGGTAAGGTIESELRSQRDRNAGGNMQLVLIYLVGALLAAGMAYYSGPATPAPVFWLYVVGALAFALAAAGQYFKQSKSGR
jgi:4-amino-4-deoxy-L-arabinose transferase-like glycosyltransferase